MSTEVLFVQGLVLVFTGALWWIARRDLLSRAASPPAVDTADLEQLCATLETLVTNLSRRLDAVEAVGQKNAETRQSSREPLPIFEMPPRLLEPAFAEPVSISAEPVPVPAEPAFAVPVFAEAVPADPLPDPRYTPVYALLASGVSDPIEIARQTGLGRGEVDLILSLRDRRAF